jgi:hypothetical protein
VLEYAHRGRDSPGSHGPPSPEYAQMPMFGPLKLRKRVEEAVRSMVRESLPGPEKRDAIVQKVLDEVLDDETVRVLDDLIKVRGPVGVVVEAVDGPVIKAVLGALRPQLEDILHALVQESFERLENLGELGA